MAPIKRRPHTRSHHKMKLRHRKPNISELVYKFLSLDKGGGSEATRNYDTTKCCRFCKRPKPREGVLDSLNSRPVESMANKRKDSSRNSKIYRVKRRQNSRDQTLSSCLHRATRGEGIKKMKKYIQKAIDFGVESGYLVPKDAAYRVLRVSSELMNDGHYISKVLKCGSTVSQVRGRSPRRTPIRFEDYEVQDARRRRRRKGRSRRSRRRRSRSGSRRRRRRSRRRGRRRSESTGGEEVVEIENNDDYDFDKKGEKRKSPENAKREEGNEQLNQSDGEKATEKREEDASDLSMDEEESDDEEEKKREDTTKS